MPYSQRLSSPPDPPGGRAARVLVDSVATVRHILSEETRDLPSHEPLNFIGFGDLMRGFGTSAPSAPSGISVLVSRPSTLLPGQVAEFRFSLQNDETYAVSSSLSLTDFVSSSGFRIPSVSAVFSQETVSLKPGSLPQLTCSVQIPANAAEGHYFGLLTVMPAESDPAVLGFEVVS